MRNLHSSRLLVTAATALLAVVVAVTPARAQEQVPGTPRTPGSEIPTDYVPPVLEEARQAAGIDDKTGQVAPLDVELTDSWGRPVRLGDYFDGERPVVIQMAYYRCPKLCGEISQGMVRSMKALAQELRIGRDYEVLTISFDTRETPEIASANHAAVVEVLSRVAPREDVRDGWTFLVGDDENIARLTDGLGYRFGWIEEAQQYSHPAAIIVCTPDGKISRYLYGASYDAPTVRLSLIDASQGTITPSLKDIFILSCFDFDPVVGKYTATAYTLMRIAGVTTVLVLASVIGFLLIAEKRGRLRRHKYAGTPADEVAPAQETFPGDEGEARRPPRTAFSG